MLCNGPRLDRPSQPREIELTHLVTGNEFKRAEFSRLLGREIQIIDIPNVLEAQPELDLMRSENYTDCSIHVARAKAKDAYFRNGKVPCLVEDTALYCDGLEGQPGPLIKYHAYDGKALRRLCRDIYNPIDGSAPITNAVWIVALAAWNGTEDEPQCWLGVVHGTITPELRGPARFGFDPIFIPVGSTETLAELVHRDPANKDQFSARRFALESLKRTPFKV